MNLTDLQLVAVFCEREDRRALGELYRRYGHLVVGLCLDYLKDREAAKDATMDIFERVSTRVCRQAIETFRAWLFYTSRNYCVDLLRKRVRERERSEEFMATQLMESTPAERPLSEGHLEQLPAALARLPAAQARCLKLFYLQNKSYAEVAELTGLAPKAVKSHLQNGRRNLRNHLQNIKA